MRFLRSLTLIFTLLSTVLADVQFTEPVTGTVMKTGHVVTAHWKESGKLPHISDLVLYNLYLCAVRDTPDSYEEVDLVIKDGIFARGNSVSFRVQPDIRIDKPEAYFLKMVAFGPETMVINYSERFTVTEMTGLFSSPRPIKGVHGHGDLRKKEVVGEYTIPYQLQTGLTRYAPMAKKPGSTIPGKSSPVPQFPASAYDIATTYLPAPKIQTTISASRTYSVVSVENTASPAPHPHDIHMKRFLERWKD